MTNYDRYGRDDRYRGNEPRDYRARDDDRGFIDRAGDEVRSWFGDRDAEHRRERDGDGYHFDGRDGRYENRSDAGFRGTFQRGSTSGSDDYGRRSYGASDYGRSDYGRPDQGRGYGAYSQGGSYGSDRGAAGGGIYERPDYDRDAARASAARQGAHHDDDYRSWRDRQVASFDRDYDDYRRERQDRFHNDFETWRTGRGGQTQQQAEANGTQWKTKVREHQEVLGNDGQHVGVIDHVQDDQLKLTKRDGDGEHHFLPFTAIQSVDNAVRLNVSAADAKRQWRGEGGTAATRK